MLIIADTVYSYYQHFSMPVDGDFIPIILPSDHYQKVLDNPFGEAVLINDEWYAGPNRFFVHWSMVQVFRNFPLWLQHFMDPIDSVYASMAISKIIVQMLLLVLLALFINEGGKMFSRKYLLAVFLVIPFFQNSGYYFNSMGIIDQSITYTFFYALPVTLLALYAFPFIYRQNWKWNWLKIIVWSILTVTLPLGGTLVPGIVLVGAVTLLLATLSKLKTERQLKGPGQLVKGFKEQWSALHIFFAVFIILVSLYSLYIGRNNIEGLTDTMSAIDRYALLPKGLSQLLTEKPSYLLLILVITINAFLLRKYKDKLNFYKMLKWVGVFALLYLFLLPLGGYRDYRPLIIRRDTFMPVFLGLIVIYGYSTKMLLNKLKGKIWWGYFLLVGGFLTVFTMADISVLNKNECERLALEAIKKSENEVVILPDDCTVMSWGIRQTKRSSEDLAEMLNHWKITAEIKRIYQD